MSKHHDVRVVGEAEFDAAIDGKYAQAVEDADREINEIRVGFRWGREQLALVKEVAGFFGVPYQTYLKEAIVRQALSDLAAIRSRKATVDPPIGQARH